MVLTLTLMSMSTVLLVIWWSRRSLVVVTVTGHSMVPALRDGDSLLVRRSHVGRVRRGSVVVLELPAQRPMAGGRPPATAHPGRWSVKRAVGLPGDPAGRVDGLDGAGWTVPAGFLAVTGDNASVSYDSRQVGPVSGEQLLGVVVLRVRTGRRGGDRPDPNRVA